MDHSDGAAHTHESLAAEHSPKGLVDHHLVNELCNVLWRRQRLRLAEAAAYRRRIEQSFHSAQRTAKITLVCQGVPAGTEQVADVLHATELETADEINDSR
jgi:hypothetical protein